MESSLRHPTSTFFCKHKCLPAPQRSGTNIYIN
jgi:hypothetical protein